MWQHFHFRASLWLRDAAERAALHCRLMDELSASVFWKVSPLITPDVYVLIME